MNIPIMGRNNRTMGRNIKLQNKKLTGEQLKVLNTVIVYCLLHNLTRYLNSLCLKRRRLSPDNSCT